jgi:transcriptional regulator with XRE-family HTH domain
MSLPNLEGRQEAIRLRTEERCSLREICKMTGISKGSLSVWLCPYPLTEAEKKMRHTGKVCLTRRKDRGKMSDLYKMAEGRKFSTSEKGVIAETAVKLRLLVGGFEVYNSTVGDDKVDFMVLSPDTGKVFKIQVKWARQEKEGLPTMRLRCSNGRGKFRLYQAGEFDFLVGYDLYSDTAYVFSYEEIKGMGCVSAREDAKERWDKLQK